VRAGRETSVGLVILGVVKAGFMPIQGGDRKAA